jgi:hypothetical protein
VFGSRRITFRNCRSATSNPDPTQRSSDRQPSTASRSGRPSPQSKKADHVRVSDESAGGIEDQAAIHLGIEGEVEVVERRVGIAGDGDRSHLFGLAQAGFRADRHTELGNERRLITLPLFQDMETLDGRDPFSSARIPSCTTLQRKAGRLPRYAYNSRPQLLDRHSIWLGWPSPAERL